LALAHAHLGENFPVRARGGRRALVDSRGCTEGTGVSSHRSSQSVGIAAEPGARGQSFPGSPDSAAALVFCARSRRSGRLGRWHTPSPNFAPGWQQSKRSSGGGGTSTTPTMRANGSGPRNGSEPQDQLTLDRPAWVATTLAAVLIFTIVVDILGNLLVILSVYRNKKLRNADVFRTTSGYCGENGVLKNYPDHYKQDSSCRRPPTNT
ncbi:uncharacterized protein LOC110077906, partial [Pogona vitticeps]